MVIVGKVCAIIPDVLCRIIFYNLICLNNVTNGLFEIVDCYVLLIVCARLSIPNVTSVSFKVNLCQYQH